LKKIYRSLIMATPSDIIQRDTRANQGTPSANAAGVLFYVSDEEIMERWSGSAWESVEYGGGSAANYTEGARVYNSANITLANGTATALTFDSERWDTDTIHGTANPTRLTCNTAGVYSIWGGVRLATNSTGTRTLQIDLNGSTIIAAKQMNSYTGIMYIDISTIYNLAATNYIEFKVTQTSGGTLDVLAAANYSPEFAMQRIG